MSLSRVWPVNTFIFQTFLRGRPFDFWWGYGLFQKKNADWFWGGEILQGNSRGRNILHWNKKISLMVYNAGKKILYTIIPQGKNSITRGLGKNSYPATYKSPISHLKSKMVNPFLSFLSSRKILSLPFLLSAQIFLKIHNEWSQIHFKFAYFSFFLTALFTNKRTLKLESHLHNCIFLCRQSKNTETHKTDRNSPIKHKPWPFEPECLSKALFPERSAKMIDGSEKHKLQLAFELLSLHVFEKRSNYLELKQ